MDKRERAVNDYLYSLIARLPEREEDGFGLRGEDPYAKPQRESKKCDTCSGFMLPRCPCRLVISTTTCNTTL